MTARFVSLEPSSTSAPFAATTELGYPRSALLGAIALTGYRGGAVATHLRVGSPLFSYTLFPIYVAALLWGACIYECHVRV